MSAELPPYDSIEFQAMLERQELLGQLRSILGNCDRSGSTDLIWHQSAMAGRMALVCAGRFQAPAHKHSLGIAFVVEMATGNATYQIYARCPELPTTQQMRVIDPTQRDVSYEDMVDDIRTQQLLAYTEFGPSALKDFSGLFRGQYAPPQAAPSVAALLRERPVPDEKTPLWKIQRYGQYLADLQHGLILPTRPSNSDI